MLDLSTLDTTLTADSGAVLELRHPTTDEPLGVSLRLAGVDSKAFKKFEAANLDRFFDRMAKGKRAKVRTAEEQEREALDGLIACTLSWSGVVLDGEELACTPENARVLYARLPWVREQAQEFIRDRANYLRD